MSFRLALALAAAALLSCKEEAPPKQDRALDILRHEVDRQSSGAPMAHAPNQPEDPNAHLAGLATGAEAPKGPEGPLALPAEGTSGRLGGAELAIRSAAATHRISGGKLSLTTEEVFVTVELAARNTGRAPAPVDLPEAELVSGDGAWPIARDAQALAGTRQLPVELGAGEAQTVRLVFEVPPQALGSANLALRVGPRGGAEGDVRLRLK